MYKGLLNSRKHLLGLAAVTLVIIAALPFLHIDFIADAVSVRLAENAFFVPRDENFELNASTILKEIYFGGEYHDFEEKVIILKENSVTQNKSDTPDDSMDNLPNTVPEEASPNLHPIIRCDLSSDSPLVLNNTTSKRPDTGLLLNSDYDFGYNKDSSDPLVLVLHTHATECYSRENSTYYDETVVTRSNDSTLNMIAVGKVLTDTLENNGIHTLHCEIMHDAESYSGAYSLAADTIKEYLELYPSIRYVLDLHRDAVMYESGAKARPVTEADGKPAAQMMVLVGTDAGGANFPHWEKNLTLALKLTDKLMDDYPGLMRPVALRGASYNEQYTTGSLLIEVGTDGNSLSQAKHSAELLGKALAELIKGE